MEVVVAGCHGPSLVAELLVADAALGRHDRHKAVALRVRLAGGRAEDPAALARLTCSRQLRALGLGRRRVGPALLRPDVHHTHRLFVATEARAPVSVSQSRFALMARRDVPRSKETDRQATVKDLFESQAQVPGHEAADALELTEGVEGTGLVAVLHCI